MMKPHVWITFVCGVCLAVLGCGGDDHDDSGGGADANGCSKISACGGDVSGAWKLSQACYFVVDQPQLDFCPSATASVSVDDDSGMISFTNGMYSRTVNLQATLLLRVPKSCKQQMGVTLSCDDLTTPPGEATDTPVTCTEETSGDCDCKSKIPVMGSDSGTYSTAGNQLKVQGGSIDYCVKDSKLTLIPVLDMSMGAMGAARVQLQTTFDKQ